VTCGTERWALTDTAERTLITGGRENYERNMWAEIWRLLLDINNEPSNLK
jgi:hypothetical protein